VSQEQLGVEAGRIGAVLLEVVGGELEDLDDRHAGASGPPLSWAVRSAEMSASTRSSSSPCMTRSSLCSVRLIRWSVTRLSLKLYVRIFSERLPLRTMPRRCAPIAACCTATVAADV